MFDVASVQCESWIVGGIIRWDENVEMLFQKAYKKIGREQGSRAWSGSCG